MEKIRLKNGQEFDLVPMGINNLGGSRAFKIVSNLGQSETSLQFTDMVSIESIEHILADGLVYTTYLDCVGFKSISYVPSIILDDNTIENIYVVELSVNAVERLLKSMQAKIDKLEKENIDLKELVDTLLISNLEV